MQPKGAWPPMKKFLFVIAGFTLLAHPLFALDKEAFALHLRKALNLDTRAEIKVSSDPAPAGVGDLMMLTVMLGGAPYPVYITPDEKQYIWGFLVDAEVDPDRTRANLINLKKAHAQGSPTAPITIVEFSDLQCSHCKQAHATLKTELYKAYKPEQVRLVFKHFPLSGHDWSEPAAVACECASVQKEAAFWDMANFFFSNQEKIKKENVKEQALGAAKNFGLNQSDLEKCLSAGPLLEKVRADKKEGTAVGVTSTPSIFINGRQRRGFRDFDDIKVVIEEKLKEIKK